MKNVIVTCQIMLDVHGKLTEDKVKKVIQLMNDELANLTCAPQIIEESVKIVDPVATDSN
jgi:uncharacterized OsmC-like protein